MNAVLLGLLQYIKELPPRNAALLFCLVALFVAPLLILVWLFAYAVLFAVTKLFYVCIVGLSSGPVTPQDFALLDRALLTLLCIGILSVLARRGTQSK